MEDKKLEKKTRIKEWIMVIGTIVLVTVASIIAYNYGLKKSTPKDSIKVDNPSEEQTNNDEQSNEEITSEQQGNDDSVYFTKVQIEKPGIIENQEIENCKIDSSGNLSGFCSNETINKEKAIKLLNSDPDGIYYVLTASGNVYYGILNENSINYDKLEVDGKVTNIKLSETGTFGCGRERVLIYTINGKDHSTNEQEYNNHVVLAGIASCDIPDDAYGQNLYVLENKTVEDLKNNKIIKYNNKEIVVDYTIETINNKYEEYIYLVNSSKEVYVINGKTQEVKLLGTYTSIKYTDNNTSQSLNLTMQDGTKLEF